MSYPYQKIDVDSHIQEKPDTWTSRMSKAKWGDRIPHIEELDGKEQFFVDGKPTGMLALCPALMPERADATRWEEVPVGVYEARERFKYMDHDGIDAFVGYSNITGPSGERFQGLEPDFEADGVRAWNDYVTEEWYHVDKNRVIPLCIPPHSTMERTLNELKYCASRGHKGVILFSTPHTRGLPNYSDPYWEPLWNAAEEMSMVISFHGTGGAPRTMRLDGIPGADGPAATFSLEAQYFVNLALSGVMDRHPNMTIVCAETGIGWVPYVLEACDFAWERMKLWRSGIDARPSESFRRQVYVDFWYERMGIQQYRHIIGVDRIMWETDFPHPTALWPDTKRYMEKAFEGLTDAERQAILVDNPKRVYRLE